MPGHFTKKSSAVLLTPALERVAGEIADAFFAQTKKNIVVTDGVRTVAPWRRGVGEGVHRWRH